MVRFQLAILFFVLTLSRTSVAKDIEEKLCLGSSNPLHPVIIYLHGIDSEAMSEQERKQRKILHQVGNKLGVRFAAPRSEKKCSGKWQGKLCWPMENAAVLQQQAAKLVAAAMKCGKQVKGWLGFSNGGYFAAKLVQYCIKHPGWTIAIGSAGSWKGHETSSLKSCGPLTLAIGKKDMTHAAAKKFAAYLKERQALVEFHEFMGGHEIRAEVLEKLLSPRF